MSVPGVVSQSPASRDGSVFPAVAQEAARASARTEKRLESAGRRSAPLWLLLSLMTMAALIPLLVLSGYSLYVRVEKERAAEVKRLQELAGDLARSLDRELRGQLDAAQMLTGSRALQQGDIRSFWEHAEDAATRIQGHFVLTTRTHEQLVNTRAAVGSPLPKTANREAVDEVLRSGVAQIGNLGVGAVAQQPLYAVRLPVKVGNEFPYVLSYVPRERVILDLLEQDYRPEGWFASIIDGNGRIVARSQRHSEFFNKQAAPEFLQQVNGKAGLISSIDLEGRPSLTAYQASGLSNWTVFVWAPRKLLEEPAAAAQRTLLFLILLALVISLFAAFAASRLIRRPNQKLLNAAHQLGNDTPVDFEPTVMKDANLVGEALSQASVNIQRREAALRASKAEMQVVMGELSHRSKNLLAIIQALVGQTGRLYPDFEHFQRRLQDRLSGLAKSHDLLVQEEWSRTPLDELLKAHLRPFIDPLDERVSMVGPRLLLNPRAAQSLGMAFHELATNATKHGSLSVDSGRVKVEWDRFRDETGAERVRLRWEEKGGPAPLAAARKGFGTVVLEKITSGSLLGKARFDWLPDGVVWEFEAPSDQILPPDGQGETTESRNNSGN